MDMEYGAVALIDALGFKGLWRTWGAARVIEKMNAMVSTAHENPWVVNAGNPNHVLKSIKLTFLSDTIAVAVSMKNRTPSDDQHGVVILSHFLQTLQHVAFVKDPPLLYRGCIAVGDHLFDGNFIVGPAVDEAAEGFEKADGAFVWMMPSALAAHGPENHSQPYAMAYDVPMKCGTTFRTVALFPVFHTMGLPGLSRLRGKRASLRPRYDASFGSQVVKRENSLRFFDAMLASMEGVDAKVRALRRQIGLDEESGGEPVDSPGYAWALSLYRY